MAQENFTLLFNQNPDAYRADLASTQNNLGFLYYILNGYEMLRQMTGGRLPPLQLPPRQRTCPLRPEPPAK